MNKVKILHCADVHLGASERFLGVAAASRRIENLITFERITQTAKERAVDLLLIAGDLFDSNHIEKEWIDRAFKALADIAPIQAVIVAGNHDPLTADSPYKSKLPENVRVFSGQTGCLTFENLGVRVYGKSFTGVYMKGEDRFPIVPPQDDFCNILLLHGDTSGNTESPYNGIPAGFLNGCGMDYVALGHIHARTECLRAGSTFYAYPGCPEGQGFDELGPKGVLCGTVEKGNAQMEFIPLCRRQHLSVKTDLTGCTDPADIAPFLLSRLESRYGKEYAEHLYKITLTGALPEGFHLSVDEIAARLNDVVYFAKVCDRTAVEADLELLAQEENLKGVFVRQLLEMRKTASEEQQALIDEAMDVGLKAFSAEVIFRDDQ